MNITNKKEEFDSVYTIVCNQAAVANKRFQVLQKRNYILSVVDTIAIVAMVALVAISLAFIICTGSSLGLLPLAVCFTPILRLTKIMESRVKPLKVVLKREKVIKSFKSMLEIPYPNETEFTGKTATIFSQKLGEALKKFKKTNKEIQPVIKQYDIFLSKSISQRYQLNFNEFFLENYLKLTNEIITVSKKMVALNKKTLVDYKIA